MRVVTKKVVAVLILLVLPCGMGADLTPEKVELILREGRIVSQKDIGQGITGAKKVLVGKDGQQLEAVFKAVDQSAEYAFIFGVEQEEFFRDSYKHEIAAYELDRLLGLGLVPPAVERKIDGVRGSIQLWVDREWFRFIHGQPPPDREDADEYVHAVRLLDYLIFNSDRHFRNLFFNSEWRPVPIDHSRAFHAMTVPARPLYRFPKQPIDCLRTIDRPQLQRIVGKYLDSDQMDALVKRRQIVIDLVDAAVAERGEANVFFDWSDPQPEPKYN
jgi:hypothetical protein